jgi:hypothetical protein
LVERFVRATLRAFAEVVGHESSATRKRQSKRRNSTTKRTTRTSTQPFCS